MTGAGPAPKLIADDSIINCYSLARYYSLDPDFFMGMPLSKVKRHMYWTERLEDRRAAQKQQREE